MKNKIMKLLGIALTLAVLVGLLVPAMPTSAGNNAWTDIKSMPNTDKMQLTDNTEISAMAVAPDGKTIFVWDNSYQRAGGTPNTATPPVTPTYTPTPGGTPATFFSSPRLLKSVDAGVSFVEVKIDDDDELKDSEDAYDIHQLVISPKFATDQIVVAVSEDNVYLSEDAGESWSLVDFTGSDLYEGDYFWGDVYNADVTYNDKGRLNILVATEDGVVLYNQKGGLVTDLATDLEPNSLLKYWNSEGTQPFDNADTEVLAAKFSPNFSDDGQVVAITAMDNGTLGHQTLFQTLIVPSDVEDDFDWNDSSRVTEFLLDSEQIVAHEDAYISFPSDYSWTGSKAVIFVALCQFDAYRVNLASGDVEDAIKKATNLKIYDSDAGDEPMMSSMDYKGTASSGTLVVAVDTGDDQNSVNIYRTKNANTGSSPDWFGADKNPMGGWARVEFSPTADTLFVGTFSDSGYSGKNIAGDTISYKFGSALYTSADYNSFEGISLIAFPILSEVTSTSWNARYLTLKGPTTLQVIFTSTTGGTSWKMSLANTAVNKALTVGSVKASPTIATDNTFYLFFTGSENNIIYKTTNLGATYDELNVRTDDKVILDFQVIDANNYLVAGKGGEIFKNTQNSPIITIDPIQGEISAFGTYSPTFFAIETTGGYIYFSGDNGVTWKKLGETLFQKTYYDSAARTAYLVDKSSSGYRDLYKYNVDNSSDWELVDTIEFLFDEDSDGDLDEIGNNITNINYSNGVWYAQIGADAKVPQYWRCVNITENGKQLWEGIPGSSETSLKGGASKIGAGNLNVMVGLNATNRTWNKLATVAKNFNDSLVNGPTISSPANNALVLNNFNVNWNAVDAGSKSAKYEIQIATDNLFNGTIDLSNDQTNATTYYVTPQEGLVAGTTYYARVKVVGIYADGTLSSKWSPTVAFTVKLNNDYIVGVIGSRISPAAGAVGVPQKPTFQWGAVPNATGYELVIDNGAAIKLTDTTYIPDAAYAYGSTHTWKVRAMAGTVASDYVTSIFTVVGAPPAPTTTAPPAPKFFDPNSGQYFDTQAQLDAFQAAWKAQNNKTTPAPETPAYIWVIIVIGAVLIIAVIVLIARTRRV